ncbi:E3 ubiquitin-protein ligase EL5 [Brachypodium distachyon]|uniref:RING-type E3 ubiquitin transferase n=1 Tax=Brachypodium distachyon TaxID=15368 RepID=I1IAL7_BRADI|nr:E3 ubiquitin-protein ligase EL5 [Brachypodium distachyon]KQJ99920.1 hypothetical protein BRADI_3g46040v3 [Brachypodium distachyon]|eukprot:XP_003572625.1 E3 ubiquitin-protein ligase EL5 [Brachypodium distachyon]
MATQGSDQGAASAMDSSSGWAVAPAAAAVSAAGPSMSLSGILTLAGIFLVFAMFALALVFLQYRFNNGFPTAPGWPPRIGVAAAAAGNKDKGVDPELLRSLPVTLYRAPSAKDSTNGSGLECAVCLAELEDGQEARFLPRCGHGFHAACVDTWLAAHSTCPLCRVTVAKAEADVITSSRPRLAPVPPEPANYAAANVVLPASALLLGTYDQATRATVPSDGGASSSAPAVAALVIDIPEACVVPRDAAAKSPGLGRLRSLKGLWSFGRPAGSSIPSCSCGSGGGMADVERGVSIRTVGARAELPPEASSTCATPRPAV